MTVDRKFKAFNPYLTFSDPLNEQFVMLIQDFELDEDMAELFKLGRTVYSQLTPQRSEQHFNEHISAYFDLIEQSRHFILKLDKLGRRFTTDENEKYWNNATDEKILLRIIRDCIDFKLPYLWEMPRSKDIFLYQALVEIDNVISSKVSGNSIVSGVIAAVMALSHGTGLEIAERTYQDGKKNFALKGVRAWRKRDPKQKEKNFIHECWQKWQENPKSYRSKAAFARDMLTKCEYITSQKKIEDWCREWESKKRTDPVQ